MSRGGLENRCATGFGAPRHDQKYSSTVDRGASNSTWRFCALHQTFAFAPLVSTVSTMQRFYDTRGREPQSHIAPPPSLCSFEQALPHIFQRERYQEKGFALRSSRMRTAVFCQLGTNSASFVRHRWDRHSGSRLRVCFSISRPLLRCDAEPSVSA